MSPVRWVSLDEEPVLLPPPERMIYSTKPRRGLAADFTSYVIKGPESQVVAAEHVGYELASLVDLETPDHALWKNSAGEVHFACAWLNAASGYDRLLDAKHTDNLALIADATAFDVWIANGDRNVNNLIGVASGGRHDSRQHLVAIDFEKALALIGVDQFTITGKNPHEFLPGAMLLPHLMALPRPQAMCERIAAVTEDQIGRVIRNYALDKGSLTDR